MARPTREPRVLTPAEARALVAAAMNGPLEAYVILALAVGLRPGELCGLCWDDLDLDVGILRIERARKVAGGRVVGLGPM